MQAAFSGALAGCCLGLHRFMEMSLLCCLRRRLTHFEFMRQYSEKSSFLALKQTFPAEMLKARKAFTFKPERSSSDKGNIVSFSLFDKNTAFLSTMFSSDYCMHSFIGKGQSFVSLLGTDVPSLTWVSITGQKFNLSHILAQR